MAAATARDAAKLLAEARRVRAPEAAAAFKRGFKNIFAKVYTTLNVEELNAFDEGTVITAEMLKECGFISKINDGIKILGQGELSKKLTVKAVKFTASAKEKIEAAGGTAEEIY